VIENREVSTIERGDTAIPPVVLDTERPPRRIHPAHRLLLRADGLLVLLIRVLLALSVVVELVVVLANIFDREFLHHSLSWELSASEVALLAIGFLGGAVAFCNGQHIAVDYFTQQTSKHTRLMFRLSGEWLAIGLTGTVCVWAVKSYSQASLQAIPDLSLSGGVFAVVLAISMGVIAIDTTLRVSLEAWRDNLVGLGVAAGFAAVIVATSHIGWFAASQDHALILCTVLAVAVIFSGIPLTLGLLLFLVVFTITGHNVTTFVPLGMESGLSEDFVLLAIPFFVLAGYLLTEGGLAKAIVDLLSRPLRRVPGGNLQLTVGTMFLFSGMTGAKIADVTAVGTAMTDSLVEDGFSRAEIACVLASCASAGETVPPSIALLILGSVTTISIGTLFVAGILPALLVMVAIGVLIGFRDHFGLTRANRETASIRPSGSLGRRLSRGLLAIGLPVILVVGIESGSFTATEASAVAVLYALIVTCVGRPRLTPKQLWRILEQSAAMAGLLLLIITIASTVGQGLAEAQVPQRIAQYLASLGDSKTIFLLVTIAVVPIIGALLEGAPAILIFGPLFVPTAQQLGINLVHFGIVFILALAIGSFSPLLGIGFYTACRVAGADVRKATRQYLPYFGAMIGAVVVVAFVPSITLVLPRLLHYAGA
jgi:tripartite ATP-independent transporter DctM subunit